jgi:hypothetical protein
VVLVFWVSGPCRRMRRDGLWMFMVVRLGPWLGVGKLEVGRS